MRPCRALAYAAGLIAAFAAPSAFMASRSGFDPLAIALVITAFAGVIWLVGMLPALGHAESARRIERALRIVIIGRIIASIVPCGIVDMVCGTIAIEWVTDVDPTSDPVPKDFTSTLAITALQGAFVFIQFVLLAPISYYMARTWGVRPNPDSCAKCGYDIRASRQFGRCPECGTPCRPAELPAPGAASGGDGA